MRVSTDRMLDIYRRAHPHAEDGDLIVLREWGE